jgi:hypothetical protein
MKMTTSPEGLLTITADGLRIVETAPGEFTIAVSDSYLGDPVAILERITTARLDATIADPKAGLAKWERAFNRGRRV